MTRINSNIASLIAQSKLKTSNDDLQVRLERLATGLRINRGADDPAGLIVSERLRSELRGIEQGIRNSERASNVIATTEASLTEVNDLLNSIRALVVEAANTGAFSPEEIAANQLQIDSAIESITRISNTASFAGLKLLNGSLAYDLSGIDPSNIVKTKIHGAALGDRDSLELDVEVLGSAQQGMMFFNTEFSAINGAYTDGILPSSMTLEIAGPQGVTELTFVSGTTINDIVDAINSRSNITGVSAARQSAANDSSGIVFKSTDYGSNAFVSVDRLSGGSAFTFAKLLDDQPGPVIDWSDTATYTDAKNDTGKDVIILLNGAVATGDGLEVAVRNPELDLEFLLDSSFASTVDGSIETFHITGGGSMFQLGPDVTAQQQINIGIESVAATRLGGTLIQLDGGGEELQFLSSLKSGGPNSLNAGNLQAASAILGTAIDDVTTLRGRLGAFERNVLDTNVRSLQNAFENITASESVIRDADFAIETSELTRAQVLVQTGTSVLATANANAQSVLQLLG